MQDSLLELRDIAFERDDRLLFSRLSEIVHPGDLLQVAGPNGAGKTTLLRILTTSLRPTAGALWFRGEPVDRQRDLYLANVLYVGHQPGIKGELTPLENLLWLQRLQGGLCRTADLEAALIRVGLAGYEDVPSHQLSQGQTRRVALARLYLSDAPLWILDEPFAAIDKQGVAHLEALFGQHCARGGAVVLSTHQDLAGHSQRVLDLTDAVFHEPAGAA